jgi:hypothetical protein
MHYGRAVAVRIMACVLSVWGLNGSSHGDKVLARVPGSHPG